MSTHKTRFLFFTAFIFLNAIAYAQDSSKQKFGDSVVTVHPVDSLTKVAKPVAHVDKVDSVLKHHSAKKAALYSAILPGLGQIYNKKYWKLPIIYGALGISGSVFAYNLTNYKDLRFAYKAKFLATQPTKDPVTGRYTGPPDSSLYSRIKPELLPIDLNSL